MRIAVVQRPPVLLNRSRTIADAVAAIREVAANGVRLVVFPEAYIPGVSGVDLETAPGRGYGARGKAPLATSCERREPRWR